MYKTLDPVTTAGLVTREVQSGSRDGTRTKIVIARRTYSTHRADLWDALTNVDRLPRWFLPLHGDLRPGGRYHLEGNASGTIERCEEPELLALTWEWESNVSWVTVTLTPNEASTILELSHEAHVDDFWDQYGPGAGGIGWDLALIALGVHLASGTSVDPAEAEAFALSAQGTEFVRRAADGWAAAAIDDGEDASAAHAAADRTVAFYTGPAEAASEATSGD